MTDTLKAQLDERLEATLVAANYRATIYQQRENAKVRLKQALTIGKNGGIFKIDQGMIGFIQVLIDEKKTSAVLLDINETPILIDDLKGFKSQVLDKYFQAMNDYILDMQEMKKARNTAAVLGLGPK